MSGHTITNLKVLIMHEVHVATLWYSWKYWWELNLAVKIAIARIFGGFKFGGSVWDHHTHNYMRVGNFGGF